MTTLMNLISILTISGMFCVVYGVSVMRSDLVFVIDDTASMGEEITQVRDSVNKLFDIIVNSNTSQVEDFILYTFNDPDVVQRTITKDRAVFRNALASIKVGGGGDCPESSMSGIHEALKVSRPGSYFYVFTDAAANDRHLYEQVKSLALNKQCQITFILTEDSCYRNKEDPDYMVYDHLAEVTYGQVFDISETQMEMILKYVRQTVKERPTVITSKTFPPGSHKLNYEVDSKMKELVISVTGLHAKVDVTDPDGEDVDTEEIFSNLNAAIVKVNEVKPGKYIADVKSDSTTRVTVTGSTSVHFLHGFSGFKPTTFADLPTRPIAGEKSYLSLKLTTNDTGIILIKAKLMDMDRNFIIEKDLTAVNEDDDVFYVSEPFVPPNMRFQIAMEGLDVEKDFKITRIGLAPVEPQVVLVTTVNKAPEAKIPGGPKINVIYDEPVQLKCKVTAYPKPTITWTDKNGVELPGFASTLELPYDYISILDINSITKNNTYKCKASNSYGDNSEVIEVETKRLKFFDVLETPQDAGVEYGNEVNFVCKVDASPPAIITWYKNKRKIYTDESRIISSDKSTLTITNIQPKHGGHYSCKAKNNLKSMKFMFEVTVTGVEKPQIDKTTTEVSIRKGTDITLNCNVTKGVPKPKISWFYERRSGDLIKIHSGENFDIKNATIRHTGVYKCKAENAAGSDSHYVDLIVEYSPVIKRNQKRVINKEGERVKLMCIADGEPTPDVRWYTKGIEIMKSKKYKIHEKYLSFMSDLKDNGTYTCVAENELGSANITINLDVIVPVNIQPPEKTPLDVMVGDSVKLPCIADGYPKPSIMWAFQNVNKGHVKKLRPHDVLGSLMFTSIQVTDEGSYTCLATNGASVARINYEVKVHSPPLILNTLNDDDLTAVTGDLSISIPCSAIGHPKPDITWTKDGFNVPSGTEWYDIQNDGLLVIKNIDTKSAGDYICTATNRHGQDKKRYELNVLAYPKLGPTTKGRLLQEGNTAEIECHVPHTKTDLLRWYKDNTFLSEGELTLRNIRRSDAGLYICRVSNSFSKSISGNVEIKVGYKPKFLAEEDNHVDFEEGMTAVLNCNADGQPAPKVSWWHDGHKLKEKSMVYVFEMKKQDRGDFFCLLENSFGSIHRKFDISSQECLVNLAKDFSENQPLLLSVENKWPKFETVDGNMRLLTNEEVVLHCPTGFTSFYDTEILVSCHQGTDFKFRGRTHKFSEFKCKDEWKPVEKDTGRNCFPGTKSSAIQIGYEIPDGFIEVYEVCFDKDKETPAYTKQEIHRSLSNAGQKKTKWLDSKLTPYHYESLYDCNLQISIISSILGRWFHNNDNCCFTKRQLVGPFDVPPGLSQLATYSHLNVVPHWSTCNAENWASVERRVRQLTKSTDHSLLVWTGTAQQLQMKQLSKMVDISISDHNRRQQTVPQYLWKVVQDPTTHESLAIVQLNIPDLTPLEARSHILCRDICSEVRWMKSKGWYDVRKGYTYCCSIQEFEVAFGYSGVFDSGSGDILFDVNTKIPDIVI